MSAGTMGRAEPSPALAQRKREEFAAFLFVLAETAIFTVIFASEKLTGDEIPVIQLQFLRFLGGFCILFVFVLLSRRRLATYRSRNWRLQILRSVLGVAGGAAALQAPLWVPYIDATAVELLDGVIVLFLGLIVLREQLQRLHWLGSGLLVLGAAIVVLGQGAFASGKGDAWLLYWGGLGLSGVAALCFACQALITRVLARQDKPIVMMLHINGIAALLLAVPVAVIWRAVPLSDLLPFLLLGPLGLLGQFCYVRACALAPVSLIGPLEYSRLIFAGILGWIAFQQVPSDLSLAGGAVLLVGGVILTRR